MRKLALFATPLLLAGCVSAMNNDDGSSWMATATASSPPSVPAGNVAEDYVRLCTGEKPQASKETCDAMAQEARNAQPRQ